MANKQKGKSGSGKRVAKYAKAGNKRRDVYRPVFRTVRKKKKNGETVELQVECKENMRHGPGSNQPDKYTGYPTSFLK